MRVCPFALAGTSPSSDTTNTRSPRTFFLAATVFMSVSPLRKSFQEQGIFPGQKPASPALHDDVAQAPFRTAIWIHGQSLFQQGLEFSPILFLNRDSFGIGHEGRGQLPVRQRQGTIEVRFGSHREITWRSLPGRLIAD